MRGLRTTAMAALLLLVAAPLLAQSSVTTGELSGRVVDPDQGVLPGATVEARNPATGLTRRALTDAEGRYRIDLLPPGSYEVRVELSGFRPELRQGVTVTLGAMVRLDFTLQVGAQTEEITVTADAPVVETTNPSVASAVTAQSIASLPLNGRDFLDFIALTPMSTTDDNGRAHIAGQRGVQNSFNIDGANNQSNFFGEERGTTRAPFTFSQGAIREFQVIPSSYNVQFGNASGGVINAITKSGTNELKVEGWFYLRNESMVEDDAFGHEQAQFDQKQFGAAVGGPILRDRLHYFVALDGQRKDFPVYREWKLFPHGREAEFEARTGLDFQKEQGGNQISTDNNDVLLGKLDWQISPNHLVAVRYNNSDYDGANGTDTRYLNTGWSNNGFENGDFYSVVANVNSVFSANIFNEAILQYSDESRPRIPNVTGIPEVQIRGFEANFGQRNYLPNDLIEKHTQIKDNLSYFLGPHTVKTGFDYDAVKYDNWFPRYKAGQYTYSTWDDFFNNKAYSFTQAFYTTDGHAKFDVNYYAIYLQDEWRIRPTLTVTYGVRYDLQNNPTPPVTNPLEPRTGKVPDDTDNWAPRIGFAWDPLGDGRTVVRGGFGYFYDKTSTILLANALLNNGLTGARYYFNCRSVSCPTFPNILTAPPASGADKPTIYFFDQNFEHTQTKRFSIGAERELFANLSVGVDLVYSKSEDLERIYDANLVPVGTTPWGANLYDTRRVNNTNFTSTNVFASDGHGEYTAIVLKARKRWSDRWLLDASYTYSEANDTNSNENTVSIGAYGSGEDPLDPDGNWGYSDFDVRHRVVVSSVVILPFNILASTIVNYRSGYPFTPSSDVCYNVVSGRCYDPGSVDYNAYVDGVHYRRNSFRQPSFFNMDLRLSKIFSFGGGFEAEIIAEVFNLTNSENLRTSKTRMVLANGSLDPTFNEKNLAGPPRQYQAGLKLRF
ncbi:MAG: TonB-dependent receptor [Thermoanaerobaculaceae bacterium]|nr:TonB-dependent receptor [Thermoanaerobaculaceae bacterium]